MLFHLLLSLVAVTPALDSVESAWLDTALTYLNITRHDLEYPKIWVRDPAFLTTIARRSLDHPLDAPSMVDSIEENVVRMQDDPADLTVFLAGLMDVNPRKAEFGSEQPGDIPSPIPVELRGPLVDLIGALKSANSIGSRAFVRLTEEKIDTLLSDAVYWWSDEDDSLDETLRGVRYRERLCKINLAWKKEEKSMEGIVEAGIEMSPERTMEELDEIRAVEIKTNERVYIVRTEIKGKRYKILRAFGTVCSVRVSCSGVTRLQDVVTL